MGLDAKDDCGGVCGTYPEFGGGDFSPASVMLGGTVYSRLKLWFNHKWNPLHWYCRLIESGFGKAISRWLAQQYERFVYSWLSPLVGWLFRNNRLTDEEKAQFGELRERQRRVREGNRELSKKISQHCKRQNENRRTDTT